MQIFEKLIEICRNNPQTVLFAEANDPRIIKAARYLSDNQLAHPVLLGGGFEIREMADQINISSRGLEIINHKHYSEYNPFIEQLGKKQQYRDLNKEELQVLLNDALFYALTCLEFDKADFVLAGNMSTIRMFVKKALDVLEICDKYIRASAFYLLISRHDNNVFAFADCSINVNPSAEIMAEIAIKTSEKYNRITGLLPKVAFLSFSTKGSARPENINKILQAIEIVNKKAPSLQCDGELQFDAAINQAVAVKKGANNILNGKANVFIFPSLDSANIGQKIAEQIGGYLSVGPMIQGFKKSIHHLPKSCTVESVINSALLASFLNIKN